jgi:hypothetical protein
MGFPQVQYWILESANIENLGMEFLLVRFSRAAPNTPATPSPGVPQAAVGTWKRRAGQCVSGGL